MRHKLDDNFDRRERTDDPRFIVSPTRAGPGWKARLWRASGRWYVTIAVLALLWANARYLSADSTGNWPALAPTGNIGQPNVPYAMAVRRAGLVLCVDPGSEQPTDEMFGLVAYAYRSRSTPGSAIAFETEEVVSNAAGSVQIDPADIRAAYLAWLAKHPNTYWQRVAARLSGSPALAGANSLRTFEIIRTIAVMLLVALLIRSLAWTIPILDAAGRALSGATLSPAERAALKRKKALLKGLCPACGYDIRRLPARVCPECAHRWNEREASTVPRT